MRDQDEIDDEDEVDEDDIERFDISDVQWDMFTSKNRKRVSLAGRSAKDFNMMRIYLWLRATVDKMELEMGIHEEPPEAQ